MRIVGGDLRGRRLAAKVGVGVRPTPDRIREAVFNVLAHGADYRTDLGPALDRKSVV